MNIFEQLGFIKVNETISLIDRSGKYDIEWASAYLGHSTIADALDHYCHLCKRGFKTIGGAKNHKRLAHK